MQTAVAETLDDAPALEPIKLTDCNRRAVDELNGLLPAVLAAAFAGALAV